MKKIILLCCCLSACLIASAKDLKDNFTGKYAPEKVGAKVCARFIEVPHPNFDERTDPPQEITYPETCAWLGAIRFARTTKDKKALEALEERLYPLFGDEMRLLPVPNHVDHNVFGSVPLQLYMHTGNKAFRSLGLWYADTQWQKPASKKENPEHTRLLNEGLSWQTRYWIDDMFMITALQAQAYLATGDEKYIERAAKEMILYLDELPGENGVFYHAPTAKFFWARGNGWMAVGMPEMLRMLPKSAKYDVYRNRILTEYKKMMATLSAYQYDSGLWGQLIYPNQGDMWEETSGSAMFTYAMILGVKNGWLDRKIYGTAARKAWITLLSYLDEKDNLRNVCEGTGARNSAEWYQNRRRLTGDMHGQAAMLWCAYALSCDVKPYKLAPSR